METIRRLISLASISALLGCAATGPTQHPQHRYNLGHDLLNNGHHSLVLVPRHSLRYSFDLLPGTLSMSPEAEAIARADFLTAAQRYCPSSTPEIDGVLETPWGSWSSDRVENGRIIGAGSLTGLLKISGTFVCR